MAWSFTRVCNDDETSIAAAADGGGESDDGGGARRRDGLEDMSTGEGWCCRDKGRMEGRVLGGAKRI